MNKDYARLVTIAAWSATIVASLLLCMKLYAWWVTESVSLLASLLDSFFDIAASLVNLVVIRYSLQPADREHAFGHGKAESLAALAQSMFISGSACFLILNGIDRFFRGHQVLSPESGVAVSVIAIVMTLGLVMFQQYVVRKTKSQAIAADSLHYMTDLYMNVAIIIALGLSWYGFGAADSLFAIGIGVYILISAYRMAHEAIQTLLDRKLPDEEIIKIRQVSLSVQGVLGVHGIRTRMSGPIRFIQLHLELDDDIHLIDAHETSDQVERLLLKAFPGADILVHQDPYSVVFEQEKDQKLRGW